jgi:hypothetical protein
VRTLCLLLTFTAALARAEAECDDDFTECKDDCVVEYGGSTRVEMKKLYEKCMKKCIKTVNRCTERVVETKNNKLDDGALDHSPGSDEVDKNNMPTRTSRPGKKPTAEPGGDEDNTPSKPHDDLSDAEVPKSSRTQLKADGDKGNKVGSKPPPSSKPEPAAAEKDKPPAPKKEEPIRMELKRKDADEDLRDDKPRQKDPEPEPAPPPKKREEPKPPPPKKEEDHDDLRNY